MLSNDKKCIGIVERNFWVGLLEGNAWGGITILTDAFEDKDYSGKENKKRRVFAGWEQRSKNSCKVDKNLIENKKRKQNSFIIKRRPYEGWVMAIVDHSWTLIGWWLLPPGGTELILLWLSLCSELCLKMKNGRFERSGKPYMSNEPILQHTKS